MTALVIRMERIIWAINDSYSFVELLGRYRSKEDIEAQQSKEKIK